MPGGFLPVAGAIQRSFGGGELAPALHARADQVKYVGGLKQCRNFEVLRAGGARTRGGTRYVATCKTNSPTVQLLAYVSELTGESILIEAGASYLRFFKNGAAVTIAVPAAYNGATAYVIGDIVLSGGVNYYCILATTGNAPPNVTFWYPMPAGNLLELPSPFPSLFAWSQQGRTITMTHEDINPYELTYEALTRWTLVKLVTGAKTAQVPGIGGTPGGVGTRTMAYKVTAAGADYEEGPPSGVQVFLGCADPTLAAPNIITWTLVAGALEYYVYLDPFNNGTFGYIGTATGAASFRDIGFVADFTVTPPISIARFSTALDFPKTSASYQQRRCFGFTKAVPDGIDASRIGYPSNFGISSPLQDDDALRFRIVGRHHQPVQHLLSLKQGLIVLSSAGEWTVTGGQGAPLTPGGILPDQQAYLGSAAVRPIIIGNSIIYVQARGSIMRDLQFDIAVEGLAGRDMTVFSSHLFDGHTIRRMDYAQTPNSIVWAVREDGVLLGCTYLREQDVWGWHRHDTDGFFWDVCIVPEAAGDTVYFIVRRTVNGATVRYIEKMMPREIAVFDTDAICVDASLSYSGAPVNTVAGLAHLEAKRVAVVGDGAVISDGVSGVAYTVVAGAVTPVFPASYSNIHVGLPFTADLETLDLDVQGSSVREKQKAIGPLAVLLEQSSRTFLAGPDSAHLKPYAPPAWDGTGDQFTGQVEMNISKAFNKYGRVFIRQAQPLPLTVLGVIPGVELGG